MQKNTAEFQERAADMEVYENAPLHSYSYMKTGGNASKIIVPLNEDAFIRAVKSEDAYVLGNCSNVLFPDEGVTKTIIITTKLKKLSVKNDGGITYLTAECGASLSSVARLALENSLSGVEFAHGIPGTVGGAVYMNAGAYGGEIKDIFHSCRCLDEKGNIITLKNKDMAFSYRYSILHKRKLILISATFALKRGNKDEIKALMDDLMDRRRSKQPLEYPSVGSFFKRPKDAFAAKLIEDAGLKGVSVGGAQVSEKHSGFIINKGGATTTDILALAEIVEKSVYEKFGTKLEKEAIVLK